MCTRCGNQKETKSIQLHTAQGFKEIYCTNCKQQERCLYNWCQCGCIWHQCITHHVDPEVNSTSRKARKKVDEGTKPQEKKTLSSWRMAPKTERQQKEKNMGKKKQQRRRLKHRGMEEVRHTKFQLSNARPQETMIQRIRRKQEDGDKKDKKKDGAQRSGGSQAYKVPT